MSQDVLSAVHRIKPPVSGVRPTRSSVCNCWFRQIGRWAAAV
ncbi:hypothetical protein GPEL0_01r0834 [Geoanaerobacter pelophilus]|uniref:Uncharacterized protein n=1 Tax=Geoanaerobacter pelophilus TaxID=60036 RepID=A0ABQ0MFE7_9BACT|nr:hypothetical protein GPEL0_01r0834 [Geoanaerobacter pelophilus]